MLLQRNNNNNLITTSARNKSGKRFLALVFLQKKANICQIGKDFFMSILSIYLHILGRAALSVRVKSTYSRCLRV